MGCPQATYIKEDEEEAGGQGGRAKGGVQLGFAILVGFPFLFQEGEGGKEREKERKKGVAPLPLVQFGLPWGAPPCGLPSPTPF